MKKTHVLLVVCLFLVAFFGCGDTKPNDNASVSETIQAEKDAYYKTFERFQFTFTNVSVEEKNYKILSSDKHAGVFYEIYDNDGNLLDYGYHGYRGRFDISSKGDIITLEYGFGGTSVYPQYRFYDVSKGSVSRYFDGPVAVWGTRIASFSLRDEKALLIVQDAFDKNKVYKEFTGKFDTSIFMKIQDVSFSTDGKTVTVKHCEINNESHVIEETFHVE